MSVLSLFCPAQYSRSYSAVSSPTPAPYTAARSAPAPPAAPAPATAASGLQLPLGGLSGAGAGLGSSYLLHNLIIGQIQSLTGTATSAPGGHTQNLATKAEPSPSAVASSTIPLLSGKKAPKLNHCIPQKSDARFYETVVSKQVSASNIVSI